MGRNVYIKQSWRSLVLALVLGLSLDGWEVVQAQELVWAKRAGGEGLTSVFGQGIAVDRTGNSYVTGWYGGSATFLGGSATFGLGEANETTLEGAGLQTNIFVAKYASSGELLWVKGAGGQGIEQGFSITVDGVGNSYVTGWFTNSATFGAGESEEVTLEVTNQSSFPPFINADTFVAKYTSNGNLAWAKRARSEPVSSVRGRGIGVDGAGNSYVTGFFHGSATFGLGELNETILDTGVFGGHSDTFVSKYTPSGNLAWAEQIKGTAAGVVPTGIVVDDAGQSYVTGNFNVSATFGPGGADETTLVGIGSRFFIAKYTATGNIAWAKQTGGGVVSGGIAVDETGNSYVTGQFPFNLSGTVFGPGEPNETRLMSTGGDTIFVAKHAPNGNLIWVKGAGGALSKSGQGIVVDSSGHSYITGVFNGSLTFGSGESNETTLTSTGENTIFVAKYDPNGNLIWAQKALSPNSQGIGVDDAGNSYITGSFLDTATFGLGEQKETTLVASNTGRNMYVAKFNGSGTIPTPTQHTLTVAIAGLGRGMVTSSPPGITCEADCTESYPDGTLVTLTATPTTGSNFGGWSGSGCSGIGNCVVTMTAARSVMAFFEDLPALPLPTHPDINGDGRADVVWRNTTNGATHVWQMTASGLRGSVTFPGGLPTNWVIQDVADVNGDGRADLIWRNVNNGATHVWQMTANGTRGPVTFPGGLPTNWVIQAVADVNGDGRADLVWRNMNNGATHVWQMTASGLRGSVTFPGGLPTNWVIQDVADVNGDGRADLIWRNMNNGATHVWQMTANGLRGPMTFPGGLPLNWEVQP